MLLIAGTALAVRVAYGPFRFGVSVANPINAESFVGLSALLLLVLRSAAPRAELAAGWKVPARWDSLVVLVLLATGVAAWAWSAPFPFIADDYWHISNALHATPAYLAHVFIVPAVDHFFRPLGYVAYSTEAWLWGRNSMGWHFTSLAVHIANGGLVYRLARIRRLAPGPSAAAALLFLVSGSRPEAVAWVAAQFDLWAAMFFLLALLAFDRFVRTRQERWELASLGALLLALLSKESAYVFPLAAVVLLGVDRVPWKRSARLLAPAAALTLGVFAYRWRLLGGIGGYRTAETGLPFFYSVSPFRTAKALLLRLPAILNFPVNWTRQPEWWLAAAFVAALIATGILACARPNRRELWFALGLLLSSAIPVHQFLLIDANLEKSRVVYLPSAGFCLLFAVVLSALDRRLAIAAASAILVFQTAALEHNLRIYGQVAALAERDCAAAAANLRASPGPALVSDVPNYIDGVYFLHTGLRQCIEWAYGGHPDHLYLAIEPEPAPPDARRLVWDEKTRALRWLP